MTLDELLLQKLADWRPENTGQTLTIDHPASGWRVAAAVECVDTLGCRLREVVLDRLVPLTDQAPLADQAQRIANRVTGLLEPLRVIEVDSERHQAQLRSGQPGRRGAAVQYYEVIRHPDGTTRLNRYETTPNAPGKRQAIGFTLTHEALAKIVADLASA